ncbi:hypothetical protein CHUAL_011360 [Chamberlinius hualienensis]
MDSIMEVDDQQSQGENFFDDPNNDFMVFYKKYLENQKDIAEKTLSQQSYDDLNNDFMVFYKKYLENQNNIAERPLPQQSIEDLFADLNDDFMTYYQKYLEDQLMEMDVQQEPMDIDNNDNQTPLIMLLILITSTIINSLETRALVVGIAYAKWKKEPSDDTYKVYNKLRNTDRKYQIDAAKDLHKRCNVPEGPCSIRELEQFQQHLIEDIQIVVFKAEINFQIIYKGPEASISIFILV